MAVLVTGEPSLVIWSIIPARGGSKGIPGKNLKKIQGRSLVARAVAAAHGAHSISRVFVSTDDRKIAAEAQAAGAEIVLRPEALATDTASSESALLDALAQMAATGVVLPDIVVFQQCTSPFVTSADIEGTVKALQREAADTALAVAATHGFLWRFDGDGCAIGVNHDKAERPRRQDRQAEFLETGAVYAMRTADFLNAQHRFFGKTALYEMPLARAMEIDTPSDLMVARAVAPFLDFVSASGVSPSPLGGVVFDFDGVMTDDTVLVSEAGQEAVVCSRSDGLGLALLKQKGIHLAVISREKNPIVAMRCVKLDIACISACDDKLAALTDLCRQWACSPADIIFVGNDIPDTSCLEMAGLGVVVADAHPQARAHADLILSRRGGQGAVRELCDMILADLQHTTVLAQGLK